MQKHCFHVKMDLWIAQISIRCAHFQFFKSLFHKINFSPICYDILNESAISQERKLWFQNFCTKIELKEQPLKNSKNSILIFWPNRSLSMCWDTYLHALVVQLRLGFTISLSSTPLGLCQNCFIYKRNQWVKYGLHLGIKHCLLWVTIRPGWL